MPLYRMRVVYDGATYHGWQRQKGTERTIQQKLEEALSRILQEKVAVTGASRTDAGVHALAQEAHFESSRAVDPGKLAVGVNALLPPEIAVRKVRRARGKFHARFDARWKKYTYRIRNGPEKPVWDRDRAWHVRYPLDLAAMRKGARCLVGRHDFKAFTATDGRKGSTVRTVHAIRIRRTGRRVRLDVIGDGFLYNMVRSITGTLVDVGRGRTPASRVRTILASRDRKKAGPTAPGHGLFLVKVSYRAAGIDRKSVRT